MKELGRFGCIAAITALLVAVPFGAGASVRKDGTWPASDQEKKVSFDFDGKPSEGLQKLAKEAGWSLVLSKGIAEGEPEVHIDVDDQPADAVLEALFARGAVIAKRSGSLVTIVKDDAPGSAPPPAPAAAPVMAEAAPPPAAVAAPVPTGGKDSSIVGFLLISRGETVHNATVTGRAVVEGTVTGDLVVVGGSATLKKGARVVGNASVVGGNLTLDDGARIDGSVSVTGGSLDRAPGAFIGGGIEGTMSDHDSAKDDSASDDGDHHEGKVAHFFHEAGQRVGKLSLLFVLGCVLLALLGGRMDRMRAEIAVRPMRSFALGILGSIAAVISVIVLCVTIIGIPLAVIGVLLAFFACYGAVAAILTTLGAGLVGHRTQNVYVHLLVGCAALFVVGAIPYVGGLVSFVLAMMSIGVLVATRAGGILERRTRPLV